jgi:hypothetical protein
MTSLATLPRAERLLIAAIAAQPEGAKLSIPRLRDALVNQADVLAALKRLVDAGKLDSATLRPVKRAYNGRRSGHEGNVPARPLFDALKAEGARRGLSVQQTSLAAFGNKARIYQLLKAHGVRSGTAEKIRAWIASGQEEPCSPPPARKVPLGDRRFREHRCAPPKVTKVAPGKELRPSGENLFKRLLAEGEARGLKAAQVSREIFGGSTNLYSLKGGSRAVAAKTFEKAEAWLATPRTASAKAAEQPGAHSPAPSAPDEVAISGAALAAELDALIAKYDLTKTKVGVLLFGMKGGVELLRRRANVTEAVVGKVRNLLRDPPLDRLRRERAAPRKGDPTQPPATPLMDEADRRSAKNARIAAGVNRAIAREAEQRLSGEKVGGVESPAVRSAMQLIRDRKSAEERQTNPVEQAKLALQRKGLVVYSAEVRGGRKDRFIVSGQPKELTPAELIDLAERKTGETFRRSAA